MPVGDGREGGTHAAEHADNQAHHDGEQGPVLAAREHGDARGEAVDAVEVEEIGDEGRAPGDSRRGEEEEGDGEVERGEQDSREGGDHFADVVGESVVAGCRLSVVDQLLLAEDLYAGCAGGEADGQAY